MPTPFKWSRHFQFIGWSTTLGYATWFNLSVKKNWDSAKQQNAQVSLDLYL